MHYVTKLVIGGELHYNVGVTMNGYDKVMVREAKTRDSKISKILCLHLL